MNLMLKSLFIKTKKEYDQINKPDNYCINLKDPKRLTKHETINEFNKGPCSPVIVVPGWRGTKLMLELDCR